MALTGKAVLITGGFGVLGRAVAEAARARGALVTQVGRRTQDLADEAVAQAAVADALQAHGRLDAVINCAGRFEWRKIEDAGADLWLALWRSNVLSAVNVARAAAAHLGEGAAIINMAAASAGRAAAGMGPYAAAKAGVLRFTEALAAELKPRGVWVGSVSPTTIDTPDNRADMPSADRSKWIDPAELAGLLLDLADGVGRGESGSDLVVGR